MADLPGEKKAILGLVGLFKWYAPARISTAPTLTVYLSDGTTVSPTLTVIATAITISGGGGDDMRTLTASSSVGTTHRGALGDDDGMAWLVDDGSAGLFFPPIPVKIQSISGTTITLADPLPRKMSSLSATLNYACYYAELSNSTVTATAARSLRWVVEYGTRAGSDVPEETQRAEGLLHVVRRPFRVGLSEERLRVLVPALAQMTPRRSDAYAHMMAEAEIAIVRKLRREGLVEDLAAGAEFAQCLAYTTAAMVFDGLLAGGAADAIEKANYYRGLAEAEFKALLENRAWYDTDGDGTVDTGETNVRTGPPLTTVKGLFSGDADFTATEAFDPDGSQYLNRAFKRGMSH